jgi:hypothetical protein
MEVARMEQQKGETFVFLQRQPELLIFNCVKFLQRQKVTYGLIFLDLQDLCR